MNHLLGITPSLVTRTEGFCCGLMQLELELELVLALVEVQVLQHTGVVGRAANC